MSGYENVDIGTMAAAVNLIEITESGLSPERLKFERGFEDTPSRTFGCWNPASTPIHVYELSDVILDSHTGCLLTENKRINQSKYINDDDYEKVQVKQPPSRELYSASDIFIVGYNPMYTNYYHWIAQCIPGIFACAQLMDQTITILLPSVHPMQEECLNLIDLPNLRTRIISDSQQYLLRRVLYCPLTTGAGSFAISLTARSAYFRMATTILEENRLTFKKIYVARTDAWSRKISNEDDVISLLASLNYEIVVPGSMSIREQAVAFRNARIVVAPHGAGMSNLVFCKKGTIIYEVIPEHYKNACFCNLAIVCRLRYLADAHVSPGEGLPNFRPWTLNMSSFSRRISEIEQLSN